MRAALAPVVLLLTWAPQAPHSGDTVTFTANAPGAAAIAWDVDGDGRFEASGPTATGRWTAPGMHVVTAKVTDARGKTRLVRRPVEILNGPPVATFAWGHTAALAGQQVAFTSTSSDPDGGTLELQQSWDLNGDGVYGDASGPAAAASFPAGDHVVRLQVT